MFKTGDRVIVCNNMLSVHYGRTGRVVRVSPTSYGNSDSGITHVIAVAWDIPFDNHDRGDSFYNTSLALFQRTNEKGGFSKWITKSVIG
jgi:hypothetical protein